MLETARTALPAKIVHYPSYLPRVDGVRDSQGARLPDGGNVADDGSAYGRISRNAC